MKLFSSFTQKDTKRTIVFLFLRAQTIVGVLLSSQGIRNHSNTVNQSHTINPSPSQISLSRSFSLSLSLSRSFSLPVCLSLIIIDLQSISHIPQKLGIRSKTQSFLMGISLIHLIYTTNLSHNYCLFYVFPSCLYRIELNFNLVFFFFKFYFYCIDQCNRKSGKLQLGLSKFLMGFLFHLMGLISF